MLRPVSATPRCVNGMCGRMCQNRQKKTVRTESGFSVGIGVGHIPNFNEWDHCYNLELRARP